MKNYLKIAFSLVLFVACFGFSYAQKGKSPAMSATGKAGTAEITLKYGAPSVREREIWGKLVPYDQVWRTGANEATTLKVSQDVMIEGQKLAAGEYALFTIPNANEWTIILNSEAKQWGAYKYEQDKDVLRFKVKPEANTMTELLTLSTKAEGAKASVITIAWEKVKVSFKVSQ
jgi:hypothetical protein